VNPSEIFIRPEHRPDLRAATGPIVGRGSAPRPEADCFTSFPRSYRLSGCGEKNDKSDKKKEVGKDDKAVRDPVKDYAFRAYEGTFVADSVMETAHTSMFA